MGKVSVAQDSEDTGSGPHSLFGTVRDVTQPGEDEKPVRGAEQRIAGREHQAVIADVPGHPPRRWVDDSVELNHVDESPVRHREKDSVSRTQGIEVTKRSQKRGSVARDRHRPPKT